VWSILRNVEYTPYEGDVTCSASYRQNQAKNGLGVFERGEILLQNGILYSVFRFSQSSEIALQS